MAETETTADNAWSGPAAADGATGRVSLAIAFCLLSMTSVQFGAALSKPAMQDLGAFGATWLRLCWAAAFLLLLVRPPFLSYTRSQWLTAITLGATMAMMTLCFFAAIERIPLGLAVAIEFLGPLTVAAILGGRGWRLLFPAIAAAGVLCLSWDGTAWVADTRGLLFAFGAAIGWGGYIVLMKHAGQRFKGLEGLAVSLLFAAVVATPFGFHQVQSGFSTHMLLVTAGLAVLVPLLPYALEFMALRRLQSSTFGILMSLEPAMGAGAGLVILGQVLSLNQIFGVVLVMIASAAGTLLARR
ncbi:MULTISPECIES: EamA family transporter [unclassified Ensifer]|uniref:EamA family transporter n=1 Tax=unclassified Ensifer TaxID=2633371 RepID=UPI000813A7D6|nr:MULTISPECIES: EamA family transporter [unclassified Ensifer]OCP05681.1 permease [Ensifer sp. LC11]OCP06424.1 permease [Ensifer sp. LC13]OCP06850.1 permease [Ensifer sp. LC14]OCP31337.1 permease [Ensifer sp. LC499]